MNFGLENVYFRSINTWHKLRKLICYACFKWTLSGDSVNHTTFIRTKSLSNWNPKGLKYISADEWLQSILNDHKFCFFNPPTLALHRCLLRSNYRYRFVSKILSSFEGIVLSHRANLELLMISVASDSFMMLHTLQESTRSPIFVFPICRIVFLGSNCTVVLAILANMLSSELS